MVRNQTHQASTPKSHPPTSSQSTAARSLPLELEQLILNIFSIAFPLAEYQNLSSTIQEVKDALYHRDFLRAFTSNPSHRDVYALRWSPTRSLAYAHVLNGPHIGIQNLLTDDAGHLTAPNAPTSPATPGVHSEIARESNIQSSSKVVCIGAGAGAELVACAAALRLSKSTSPNLDVTLIDIADWSGPISKLHDALTLPPPLSTHASASARANNNPFVDGDKLTLTLQQQDVLSWKPEALQRSLRHAKLVTICFTLNELFGTSVAGTTALLLELTHAVPAGCTLLVIDSPGSYAEVRIGKDEAKQQRRKYPMKWLVDHALLEAVGGGKWRKDVDVESEWYRVRKELRYPVEIEDMRFQMHVYRRLGGGNED